jgi:sn-1 stearoyl-lipid 9-desaturase
LHALGITIGYHRLLAHRAFQCPKFVEYFWVGIGYLAFMSSPMWWTTIHRAHHRYTDTPLDPHGPQSGLWRAYFAWFFGSYSDQINPQAQAKDLVNDPVYKFLEQGGNWNRAHLTNSAIGFGSRAILWALFGWKIALASLMAGLVVQQVPLILNVICHMPKLGYRTYATPDNSVNVWSVGLLAMGEGWHNNHHAFPGSARNGIKPYEIDVSWLMIKLMRACKLAWGVNELKSREPVSRAA